jgi:hypothetical protein
MNDFEYKTVTGYYCHTCQKQVESNPVSQVIGLGDWPNKMLVSVTVSCRECGTKVGRGVDNIPVTLRSRSQQASSHKFITDTQEGKE